MIDSNCRVKDVLENPIGKDIVSILIEQVGFDKRLVYNPVVKRLKLKYIARLSKGLLDDEFMNMICALLNLYDGKAIETSENSLTHHWWKEAIVYQIYPRSFYDANDDGIGDLQGIIKKLDYLKALGIDLIWLSPIYDSPNDDNGYDIRDYQKIMAEFGTMADFDALLEAVHLRGMRLIMDLVINHTSDEHQWYQEALKSKESPYRDYYIWRKSEEVGKAPNNWTSFFSGSAWNYDENNDEWGLHTFSKKQMDLNWRHKPLREELYRMINWWLEKGIDGFRLDVINYISKPEKLGNGNTILGDMLGVVGAENYFFGPHLHEYLKEMYENTFANYDVVTVGETPGIGMNMSQYFTHASRGELNLVFNFEHLTLKGRNKFDIVPYDLNYYKEVMLKWQTQYNPQCWNSLFIENHDSQRMITKVDTNPEYRRRIGKLLAMSQLTLKGTPFIFQGQELGMINADFESIDDFRDVESINLYHEKTQKGVEEEAVLKELKWGSRDNSRIPMPWDDSPNGGFSTATPWIIEKTNYKTINVQTAMSDELSTYHFYKQLIKFRHQYKTLVYGEFVPVKPKRKNVFCYYRKDDQGCFYIEINLVNHEEKQVIKTNQYTLLLANYQGAQPRLRPYECRLYRVY
jgi:oligo-1,6-glucosidase